MACSNVHKTFPEARHNTNMSNLHMYLFKIRSISFPKGKLWPYQVCLLMQTPTMKYRTRSEGTWIHFCKHERRNQHILKAVL